MKIMHQKSGNLIGMCHHVIANRNVDDTLKLLPFDGNILFY